jgi:hypothetical protein
MGFGRGRGGTTDQPAARESSGEGMRGVSIQGRLAGGVAEPIVMMVVLKVKED